MGKARGDQGSKDYGSDGYCSHRNNSANVRSKLDYGRINGGGGWNPIPAHVGGRATGIN